MPSHKISLHSVKWYVRVWSAFLRKAFFLCWPVWGGICCPTEECKVRVMELVPGEEKFFRHLWRFICFQTSSLLFLSHKFLGGSLFFMMSRGFGWWLRLCRKKTWDLGYIFAFSNLSGMAFKFFNNKLSDWAYKVWNFSTRRTNASIQKKDSAHFSIFPATISSSVPFSSEWCSTIRQCFEKWTPTSRNRITGAAVQTTRKSECQRPDFDKFDSFRQEMNARFPI